MKVKILHKQTEACILKWRLNALCVLGRSSNKRSLVVYILTLFLNHLSHLSPCIGSLRSTKVRVIDWRSIVCMWVCAVCAYITICMKKLLKRKKVRKKENGQEEQQKSLVYTDQGECTILHPHTCTWTNRKIRRRKKRDTVCVRERRKSNFFRYLLLLCYFACEYICTYGLNECLYIRELVGVLQIHPVWSSIYFVWLLLLLAIPFGREEKHFNKMFQYFFTHPSIQYIDMRAYAWLIRTL